jgi:glutamate racemase
LGCTHYPLLRDTISAAVENRLALVDSAEATAEEVAVLLMAQDLLRTGGPAEHRYLVTDTPLLFARVGSRFLGEPIVNAERVDVLFED